MTTISCGEAHALMRGALGDDGTPAALEAHLATCPACSVAWQDQRLVRALLASRQPEPLPAGFAARLDRALDDAEPWWSRFDWRWWTLRVAPAAAALLLLMGGATSLAPASSGPSTPVSTALWDESSAVSGDSLLLAVLSGSPDDALAIHEESTR